MGFEGNFLAAVGLLGFFKYSAAVWTCPYILYFLRFYKHSRFNTLNVLIIYYSFENKI